MCAVHQAEDILLIVNKSSYRLPKIWIQTDNALNITTKLVGMGKHLRLSDCIKAICGLDLSTELHNFNFWILDMDSCRLISDISEMLSSVTWNYIVIRSMLLLVSKDIEKHVFHVSWHPRWNWQGHYIVLPSPHWFTRHFSMKFTFMTIKRLD